MPRAQKRYRDCRAFVETFNLTALLNVLHLFPQFFDFDFDFDRGLTDPDTEFIQAGSFGEDRCDFTIHFLKDEVHALAGLISEILETGELIEVASESRRFLRNVAALCIQK